MTAGFIAWQCREKKSRNWKAVGREAEVANLKAEGRLYLKVLFARPAARGIWFWVSVFFFCSQVHASTVTAVDDLVRTAQATPVTIAVLANDSDSASNQLAVLRVTAPAHGKVTINSASATLPAELTHLIQFAAMQVSNTVVQVGDTNRYPRGTAQTNGLWRTRTAQDWTSGFFPAELWYLQELTGDSHFGEWATDWMGGLVPWAYLSITVDLGFKINCSFGNGYRLTGNPDFKTIVLVAAQSVTNRYNTAVGCIGDPDTPTLGSFENAIDYMMNLELLFNAATLSGDTSLYAKAYTHARRSMQDLVRADGSTFQIADYDATTGVLLKQGTSAGVSDSSTWARGQAWGTYGFTMVYQETGDTRYLNTAQRLADYYVTNVPSDQVPYWDFQAPDIPNAPKDSSAAAITLSALVELSQLATNLQDSAKYWEAANGLFASLRSSNYLAKGTISSGLLVHGTGEPPQFTELEVDVSLIYGDYYFVEALKRLKDTYSHTTVTYTPEPGFVGMDTFNYQVCDSAGNCATAAVTVQVAPTLQISVDQGSGLPVLSFLSSTNRVYDVEYVNDLLASGSWSVLAGNLPGTGNVISVTDSGPSRTSFYRLRVR